MNSNEVLVAISSLVLVTSCLAASAMTLQSLDIQLGLLNTCEPCGHETLEQSPSELANRINMSYQVEGLNVVNALVQAMQAAQITSLAHSAFNLEECCGYVSYTQNIADLSQLNQAEIATNIISILQDVVTLNRAPLVDAANIRNLNSTLCGLRTLNPTEIVENCMRPSPMAMCTRNLTCDVKINLSFLKSAYEMFKYLINFFVDAV